MEPVFPVFAFLGFILSLVPLYWQFEAWNVGVIWYIFWTSLSCLTEYFNSVVWAGNTVNSAPAWCEISIRIMMAASVGLPAASLCINRRMYQIANMPPTASLGEAEKRRAIITDSLICGLFPALYAGLQIVVQRNRFDILEDVGCIPDLYDSLPTYFISLMWPLVLGFGSIAYCSLSMHAFAASRANLSELLSAHNNLTPGWYMRMSGLALTTALLAIPLALLTIVTLATASDLSTEVSGDVAQFDFGVIGQIPRALWAANENIRATVELTRWFGPACALALFAFLGLAEEARSNYVRGCAEVSKSCRKMVARVRGPPKHKPIKLAAFKRRPNVPISVPTASSIGSMADFFIDTVAQPATEIGLHTTFSAPSAASEFSLIPATRSSTDPTQLREALYTGWHSRSRECDPAYEEIYGRPIQIKTLDDPAPSAAPSTPRGRTLV
ncbi:pheromone A receptor-domain-containing protein [Mycena galericulata]|nr:pheromone A receptor-domain-containing protein [Mycena galericulata]